MRKKELVSLMEGLASNLALVSDGSCAVLADGTRADLVPYAHGAAVALGLVVVAEREGGVPTMDDVVAVALDWTRHLRKLPDLGGDSRDDGGERS